MTRPTLARGVYACTDPTHRAHHVVAQRRCNHSAFNGNRYTPSAYSEVRCTVCGRVWRTKAAYVDTLPDVEPRRR